MKNVTYQMPVKATLVVRFENGEEREATDDDIKNFGQDIIQKGYYDFADAMRQILEDNGVDLGHKAENFALAPVVNLAATIIYHEEDWRELMSTRDKRVIAGLEHALRAMFAIDTTLPVTPGGPYLHDTHLQFEHLPLRLRPEHVAVAQRLLDTPEDEEE